MKVCQASQVWTKIATKASRRKFAVFVSAATADESAVAEFPLNIGGSGGNIVLLPLYTPQKYSVKDKTEPSFMSKHYHRNLVPIFVMKMIIKTIMRM